MTLEKPEIGQERGDTPFSEDCFPSVFVRSLNPMLLADDRRRCVDANRAACLLLRLSRHDVLERSIDDLTPPDLRAGLADRWAGFLADGSESGTHPLLTPDGAVLVLEYSATANFLPGRHLWVILTTPGAESVRDDGGAPARTQGLTDRELQVLALVAMGDTGQEIAGRLGISAATVQTHVRNALSKLGARNRAHAVALALEQCLLPSPEHAPWNPWGSSIRASMPGSRRAGAPVRGRERL